MLYRKNKVVYVGITDSIYARIAHHRKTKDIDSFLFMPMPESIISRTMLEMIENEFIIKNKPKYNKSLNCSLGWAKVPRKNRPPKRLMKKIKEEAIVVTIGGTRFYYKEYFDICLSSR